MANREDVFSAVIATMDGRERKERLRELQTALEAAEYATSRLAQLSTGEKSEQWRVMSGRYANERTIILGEARS